MATEHQRGCVVAPLDVVAGADPQVAVGFAQVGDFVPALVLEAERSQHATQHTGGSSRVGLGAMGTDHGFSNEAFVSRFQRAWLALLPDLEWVDQVLVRQVGRALMEAMEFGLKHVEIEAKVVADHDAGAVEGASNLVGMGAERLLTGKVVHRDPVERGRIWRDGDRGLEPPGRACRSIREALLDRELDNLIALRIGTGGLYVQYDECVLLRCICAGIVNGAYKVYAWYRGLGVANRGVLETKP